MPIGEAIAAVDFSIRSIKMAYDIDGKLKTAEVAIRLADAQAQLAMAKTTLLAAQEELAEKDAEIERLKRSGPEIAALIEWNGYLYFPDTDGEAGGCPACPFCLQRDRWPVKTLHMQGHRKSLCPRCEKVCEGPIKETARWRAEHAQKQADQAAPRQAATAQVVNPRLVGKPTSRP